MRFQQIAVIVPVDGLPENEADAAGQIWFAVTRLLLPALGKLYARFYPAANYQGCRIFHPLGVVFGKKEPEHFSALFHIAREMQNQAMTYHLASLLSKTDLEGMRRVGDALVCHVEANGGDVVAPHVLWYLSMQSGALLPDCGVYYAAWKRAVASENEERSILANPAGYALCAVTMEPPEGQHD